MSYNGKNYVREDKIVIGSEVEFEEGAKISGSIVAENVPDTSGDASANATVIGKILLSLKKAGLMAGDAWSLSIPTGITYANMATEKTVSNSNKVSAAISNGVIAISVGGKVEDELEASDHGEGLGKHYWLGFGIRTGLASDDGIKLEQISGMEDGKPPIVVTLTEADDAEANSVGLASGGDIILYIKAEIVRDRGMRFKLSYDGKETEELFVVIDETEAD